MVYFKSTDRKINDMQENLQLHLCQKRNNSSSYKEQGGRERKRKSRGREREKKKEINIVKYKKDKKKVMVK